ncbi:MAG: hypothetical protein AB1Z21_04625 [Synechococcaceae cyanobacterium]
MPVSSPYAVFRASDLLWPALPDGPVKRASAGHIKAPPRSRWPAVIQGELFPVDSERPSSLNRSPRV